MSERKQFFCCSGGEDSTPNAARPSLPTSPIHVVLFDPQGFQEELVAFDPSRQVAEEPDIALHAQT